MAMDVRDIVEDVAGALHSVQDSAGAALNSSVGRVQDVGETALHSAAASVGRVQEAGTVLHSAAASLGRVAQTLPLPGVPTEPTGFPPEHRLRFPGLC